MDAASSRELFDTNAPTYDSVNSAISLGLDARWRRWAARSAVVRPHAHVLDAFAGTGLVGVAAARLGADVVLADASTGMLAEAREHARERGVDLTEVQTDLSAEGLPFEDGSFDAVTVSFGVRYLDDPTGVLRRLGRLLAPEGRLVVLEFVKPPSGPVSSAAGVYFFRILPRLAATLAGRAELYRYLASSVDRVGHAEDLVKLVESAGFQVAERRSFGFGLVAGLTCVRRP